MGFEAIMNMLIMPRLLVWSWNGPFTLELDSMIFAGPFQLRTFWDSVTSLSAANILPSLPHVCSSLNCSHRALQSDGKLKETQLKSNHGSVTALTDFLVLVI